MVNAIVHCDNCGEIVPDEYCDWDTWEEECHGFHTMHALNGYKCPFCGHEGE